MIAENLRTYINNNGIKQVHIAKRLGIPISSFNSMLIGRQKLPADLFFEVCRELDVDPMKLVTLNGKE